MPARYFRIYIPATHSCSVSRIILVYVYLGCSVRLLPRPDQHPFFERFAVLRICKKLNMETRRWHAKWCIRTFIRENRVFGVGAEGHLFEFEYQPCQPLKHSLCHTAVNRYMF